MKVSTPLAQAERDMLEDLGLADTHDRIGTGPHAVHVVEAVAG